MSRKQQLIIGEEAELEKINGEDAFSGAISSGAVLNIFYPTFDR